MAVPVSEPTLPSLSFFGDSSSRDARYMVAGGIAVAGQRIAEIEDRIALLREDAGMTSELHWSAYRGGRKQEAYEALIRYAFDLINKRHTALHIIIVEFKGYDHKAKEGENKDTSINRMYFQLFLHRVARHYPSAPLRAPKNPPRLHMNAFPGPQPRKPFSYSPLHAYGF